MEALRILKAVGARPRRTIRAALWSGEEAEPARIEGVRGAAPRRRRQHATHVNISRCISTSIREWGRSTAGTRKQSPAAKALFDAWLAPLKDLDGRRNVIAGITNTDHLSFKAVGVPGFTPIQDYATYDVRTHHTNVDTYERVREAGPEAERACSLAWFAYNAAMMDERFPREPK